MSSAQIVITADVRNAVAGISRVQTSLSGLKTTISTVKTAFVGMIASLATSGLIKLSDEAITLQNKLRQVTASGEDASAMFKVLLDVAVRSRAPLKDVGDLYFSIARNADALGISNRDAVKATELLSKAMSASGISAQSASGALTQLGQALQSGRLGGDELKSILENLPPVSEALARSLKVPIGSLKELGSQGKISAQQVITAILQSANVIENNFGKSVTTVSQAITVLQTKLTGLFVAFDQETGASTALSGAILAVANSMDGLTKNIAFVVDVMKLLGAVAVVLFFKRFAQAIQGAIIGLSSIWKAMTSFLNGVSHVGASLAKFGFDIAAWAGWIVKYFKTWITWASNGTSAVNKFIRFVSGGFTFVLKALGTTFRNLWGVIGTGVAYIMGLLTPVTNMLRDFLADIVGLGITLAKLVGADDTAAWLEKWKNTIASTKKEIAKPIKPAPLPDLPKSTLPKGTEEGEKLTATQKANQERAESMKKITSDMQQQLHLAGLTGIELEIQTAIYQANSQLVKEIKDDKGKIVGYTKGLTDLEKAALVAIVEKIKYAEFDKQLKQEALVINQEANRLSIKDLDLREQQAAVDQKRNELGGKLTQHQENQIRAMVAQQHASRDLLAIEQARAALLGKMTKAEAINRGVGVQQRLNPQSALGVEYQMDKEALDSHLAAKLISEDAYQSAILNLKREYANKANELYISEQEARRSQTQTSYEAEQLRMGKTADEAKTYAEFMMKTDMEKTQFAISQGAEIFSALGAQNKKAFEAAKAFNIANAIMNTYTAATKALAAYPFPFNLIAMAGALAVGFAQVSAIRSQQYSGRALGGPVMGGQTYMVGENGPELFTPAQTGNITRNGDLGGSNVNVNFTIVTNDTDGFDGLLMSRRGVISQMITDAMLEKGQRSVV